MHLVVLLVVFNLKFWAQLCMLQKCESCNCTYRKVSKICFRKNVRTPSSLGPCFLAMSLFHTLVWENPKVQLARSANLGVILHYVFKCTDQESISIESFTGNFTEKYTKNHDFLVHLYYVLDNV